jgi:L-amino acid N-acyltransferase YncA
MIKNPIKIRPATVADLAAVNNIYNHYVRQSTCTYQEDLESPEDRRRWFDNHGEKHPVIVAETGAGVIGWGSLSPFHARSAYRHTVENSVYVHHQHLGRGIGPLLLKELIVRAHDLGHRTIIAGIDAEQPASIALHAKFGFEKAGHLRGVGWKFGRWLDVIYMQLRMEPLQQKSPP